MMAFTFENGKGNSEMVVNSWGTEVSFDLAVSHMDDALREELHRELAPCSMQAFFDAYAEAHRERFGEDWIADEENPTW